jgi:hypothetical protein
VYVKQWDITLNGPNISTANSAPETIEAPPGARLRVPCATLDPY